MNSQCTVRVADAVKLPTALSTSQLYSPSSSGTTDSRRRLRSSRMVTRPRGMLPPPAVRRQNTSGAGSPAASQGNTTLLPDRVTVSLGPRRRCGFTKTEVAFICRIIFEEMPPAKYTDKATHRGLLAVLLGTPWTPQCSWPRTGNDRRPRLAHPRLPDCFRPPDGIC